MTHDVLTRDESMGIFVTGDPIAVERPSLQEPGAVLLISCYELGHQPQGVAQPLAVLEAAGYDPGVADLAVEPFPVESVRRARLAVISAPMHTALRLGINVAARIREVAPACRVCFFGLYAALNEEYLLGYHADYCIGGNDEQALLELVVGLDNQSSAAPAGFGRPGATTQPPLRRPPALLPSRSRLPTLDRYALVEENGHKRIVGYVEASRGCLHQCRHCPIPSLYHGRFFVTPAEVVLEDIRQQAAAGAAHITFGDPDFLNGPGHAMKIVRQMHREHPSLTFDCTVKIEHIVRWPHLFPDMQEQGCLFVISAVESISDHVLDILDKGHTRADVEKALAILRDAGIAMRPTWMPFTPWTTREDYRELLEFVDRHDLVDNVDPVQYSIRLLVPPGSLLLESPAMKPFLGPLVESSLVYDWTHPDPALDELAMQVARLVESAAAAGEDAVETFYRIADLAAGIQHIPAPFPRRWRAPTRKRAPRLTEPWFC